MSSVQIGSTPVRARVQRAVRAASDAVVAAVSEVLEATETPRAKGIVVVSFDEHGNVAAETFTAPAPREPPVGTLGDTLTAQRDHPAVVAALERGRRRKNEILTEEGGTLSGTKVAARLGLSRQAVDKRRQAGKLIGLATERRGYAYPAWQFVGNGLLPGLEDVLVELADETAWSQASFFLAPTLRLEGATPLAALRRGELDRVRIAARTLGEHGAA